MSLRWDISELETAVKQSMCYSDVCRYLGLIPGGRNIDSIRSKIEQRNIDTTHFIIKRSTAVRFQTKLSDDEYFVCCARNKMQLKKRLLKYVPYKCSVCDLENIWNNKPLVLQLDHINGNSIDNRRENLRFICPNCHTQTSTYAGRKTKISKDPNWRNAPRFSTRKVSRPSKNELEQLLQTHSWESLGRTYGVSGNAIKKWAKHYGLGS